MSKFCGIVVTVVLDTLYYYFVGVFDNGLVKVFNAFVGCCNNNVVVIGNSFLLFDVIYVVVKCYEIGNIDLRF